MTRLSALSSQVWDVVVVGGGITGAGILRETARVGLRSVLVEQNDFASGTSSRSSKLVHGGLRYLAQGEIKLMRESVHERAQLLRDGQGLVDYLGYLHAVFRNDRPGASIFNLALHLYALMHGRWRIHRAISPSEVGFWAPGLSQDGLVKMFMFGESQTDDSRLVLRVLREASEQGAQAYNYAFAETLLRDEKGQVTGAVIVDSENSQRVEVRARVIVNATGAWADGLRSKIQANPMLRPMRGSHLVIPGWRFRLGQVMNFFHPENGRPVFCVPWQGVVLVGTTDVDQHDSLDDEPRPSPEEIQFLLDALHIRFPYLGITVDDLQAVYAGVRPVADTRTQDPSKASREHVVLMEAGLLTVTGGKLTTFRFMALDALNTLRHTLVDLPTPKDSSPSLHPLPSPPEDFPFPLPLVRRWLAYYGPASLDSLLKAALEERHPLEGGGAVSLAEIRWMAQNEMVHHLDDLMLRRSRLGLTAPKGGTNLLPKIRPVVQHELGWSDAQWQAEVDRYLSIWQKAYSPSLLKDYI